MNDQSISNTSTVRVGPMINIPAVLRSLNINPNIVFSAVNVAQSEFDDANNRIGYSRADALLTESVRVSGCAHFGLLLGQLAEPWHLGIGGLIGYCAPNVQQGLEGLVEMLDLHEDRASLSLDTEQGTTKLAYAFHEPEVVAMETINDLTLTFMCRIMRQFCGPAWNPSTVSIPHRIPEDRSPYSRFFRAPLYFDSPECAISFESRWLSQRLQSSDPARYEQIEEESKLLHEQQDDGFISEMPAALRAGLLKGRYLAPYIAESLNIHERTLHRRLSAAGRSFRQELDAVRSTLSQQLLEGTSMPVRDIAIALGYTHSSSFIRAFERWRGVSPAHWREQRAILNNPSRLSSGLTHREEKCHADENCPSSQPTIS